MRKRNAFTLIELLVVIAVIAVLMGILMPALKKAKEQGQAAACQGNMKTFTMAVAMYANDNDDEITHARTAFFDEDKMTGGSHTIWMDYNLNLNRYPEKWSSFFRSYLINARSLICPTFKSLAKNIHPGMVMKGGAIVDEDSDPARVQQYDPWLSYSQNAYLGPKRNPNGTPISDPPPVSKLSQIKMPQKVFNTQGLNDTVLFVIWPISSAKEAVKRESKWKITHKKAGGSYEFFDLMGGFHNAPSGNVVAGKGSCAMADGHVEMINRDEAFGYAWPK